MLAGVCAPVRINVGCSETTNVGVLLSVVVAHERADFMLVQRTFSKSVENQRESSNGNLALAWDARLENNQCEEKTAAPDTSAFLSASASSSCLFEREG